MLALSQPLSRWKGHPVARAAVRPAAPVRLGRGGESLSLISCHERLPYSRSPTSSRSGSMHDPNDAPDVTSGPNDGADKEDETSRPQSCVRKLVHGHQ